MSVVRFENVSKTYDSRTKAVNNLNLEINEGEFVTLIGPSGSGKTTVLKMINSLVKPDEGELFIHKKNLRDWDCIELRRKIGYVIQDIGLFPHMKVSENISYVLKITGAVKSERRKKAQELINLMGLNEEFLDKYPRQLSGGQKQRIGVARALASNPSIILMDEPFGSVDEITRKILQNEIKELQQKLEKTIIFVTHDIEEAIKLGSRIVLLNDGRIEQEGTRKDLFFNPVNSYVREFLGVKNFTSYMNVTSVKEAYDSGFPRIEIGKNSTYTVYGDMAKKSGMLPVVDKDKKFLGMCPTNDLNDHLSIDNAILFKDIYLEEDQLIMEAIRKLFKAGIDSLPVLNREGIYVGQFMVEQAYGILNSGNESKSNP